MIDAYHMASELGTNLYMTPPKKQARCKFPPIMGDCEIARVLKTEPMHQVWEVWLASSPKRIVLYLEGRRLPWEPGDVLLYSETDGNYPTSQQIRKQCREVEIASWYYATYDEKLYPDAGILGYGDVLSDGKYAKDNTPVKNTFKQIFSDTDEKKKKKNCKKQP